MNTKGIYYSLWTILNDMLNSEALFYGLFGKICSIYKYADTEFKREELLCEIKKYYGSNPEFQIISNHSISDNLKKENLGFFTIVLQKDLIIDYDNNVKICYFNDQKNEELEKLKQIIEKFAILSDETGWFYIIENDKHGFDLTNHKIGKCNLSIKTHYNDNFLSVNDTISNFLQNNKSGLIILHGKQGTGKTSYIRYLIQSLNKRFIYLPCQIMYSISDPSFIRFISKYSDSVLILEDCEELLKPRQSNGQTNSAIVNILNISDGILGDIFKMKIICTFNTQLSNIDKALLRKGRLAARYEFKELSVEKANEIVLNQKLKISQIESPITLADLYNFDEKNYEFQNNNLVGFIQ